MMDPIDKLIIRGYGSDLSNIQLSKSINKIEYLISENTEEDNIRLIRSLLTTIKNLDRKRY